MNRKILGVIRILAILVCIGVIIYEAVHLYLDQKEYDIADDEYEEIRQEMVKWPEAEDEALVVDYPLLQIDFEGLKEVNPDFVAWLYFPCLDISYPVVQENEVDEYIHLTFDRTENKSGSIFEDILSDPKFRGMHDIVFGHNMRDTSMFGKLKYLYQKKDEDLLASNPYVYVYTDEYIYEYRVFAYYITKVGSEAYKVVNTDETYDEFLEYIRLHSAYQMPEEADFSVRPGLLTLSTCSGASGSGKRFVVHTYKTRVWNRQES
ncbi:MAG: class B sortase [Butyrivibrio sp.]|nr:class B sortase [Butyrivibrio sp.]